MKNKLKFYPCRLGNGLHRIVKIMKLTGIIILAALMQVTASVYSQTKLLTLKVNNTPIESALKEIQKQSEFFFLYNNKQIDVTQKIDINVTEKTVEDVLKTMLKGTGIHYLIKDRQIVLYSGDLRSITDLLAESRVTQQQQKTVSGKVTDPSGEPLPGASIVIKGTTQGTVTNADGEYTLTNVSSDAALVFSFVGMKTQEVVVGTQTRINVTFEADVIGIEEIVAIGYGVQKKTTVTGAISTIQGKDIEEVPVADISQTLAGRLSGVSISPNSYGGQPGYDDPIVHIRGIVTTGDNQPLVIIDGVKRNNMRQIDSHNIESITILKDASAVAPYGLGGANGVILITTKKGQKGKPVLRFDSYYGIQNPTYIPNMLSAKDYMFLQNEGYYNNDPLGTDPPNNPELINNYEQLHKEDPWKYPSSNFVDELFNMNVPVQKYNIELSGGDKWGNYQAGLGLYDQKGIFDPTNYRKYNYNMNLELQVTNTTQVALALWGAIENINDLDPDKSSTANFMWFNYKFFPTQTIIYPEGDKWGESGGGCPVGVLRSGGYKKTFRNTLTSSISVEQQLPFIEGLSVKGVFNYDPTTQNIKSWHVPWIYHKINLSEKPYTFTEAIASTNDGKLYTWLNLQNNNWTWYTYQGYLNYNRTFGKHNVSGLLVAEARHSKNNWFNARRNNFSVDIDELSLGTSDKQDYDNGGSSSTASEIGYVYRIGYSFAEKYIFEAAGRYDGHYYFAPGERWGFFPSFSAAWRISEEDYIENISQISNLKLRTSWGKSGMLAGSPYQYLVGYNLRSNAYAFGSGNLVQSSYVPMEANPNITWEISTKFDIGFDLNMWEGLLNIEFDYFHEDRTGMLLAPEVSVPVEYGLSLSQENKGIMKNDGFEMTLSTIKKVSNEMEYSLNLNFSYAKNRMIEVFESDAQRNNPNRTLKGRPYDTPFGYKSLGLFTTDDDVNGDGFIDEQDGYQVQQFGALHPGDIIYADLSGPEGVPDGIINSHDLTEIGYPDYPLMMYGISPSMRWKNFDVSLFFQGTAMSSRNIYGLLTTPFENNGGNTTYEFFDNRWTPNNQQNAKYPRTTPSPYANNNQTSDFWMASCDYLRLKTAIIGYTLPQKITNALSIASIRCSVSGENLFTLSKLKVIDPSKGHQNNYPIMRSTNLNIDITF
jgi:TonB-linked SusC/RagA family outer membrane protein